MTDRCILVLKSTALSGQGIRLCIRRESVQLIQVILFYLRESHRLETGQRKFI
jgi:hypothetical protein